MAKKKNEESIKGLVKADDMVTVKYLDTTKFHKKDQESKMHKIAADTLVKRGTVEIVGMLLILMMFAFSIPVKAQGKIVNLLSSFNATSDTVVNTAVGYLQTELRGNYSSVTIQANVTENSGTTAGTLTLMGSLDGTYFEAATVAQASTAINTKTATDVTTVQPFIWRITGNPYLYYRVSYTGAGTMSARFSAKLLAR